jgi:hypothetical protein
MFADNEGGHMLQRSVFAEIMKALENGEDARIIRRNGTLSFEEFIKRRKEEAESLQRITGEDLYLVRYP